MTIMKINHEVVLNKFIPPNPLEVISDHGYLRHGYRQIKPQIVHFYGHEVERWLCAMDHYDPESTNHTLRTTALSVKMAKGLGFPKDALNVIQYGTILHDIGKLSIPKEIMQKPGKLTTYEYQVVKRHPVYAQEWLLTQKDFNLAHVIPLYHHEWWDGSGYPCGLQGEAIPIMARLVAVVDVWDALTSDRPYRKALSTEAALSIIHSESGTHFDPEMVAAFFKLEIYRDESMAWRMPKLN